MIKQSDQGYVTIKTLPFYGIKAVPIGKPENGKREFILLQKHELAPSGKVWLERRDLG